MMGCGTSSTTNCQKETSHTDPSMVSMVKQIPVETPVETSECSVHVETSECPVPVETSDCSVSVVKINECSVPVETSECFVPVRRKRRKRRNSMVALDRGAHHEIRFGLRCSLPPNISNVRTPRDYIKSLFRDIRNKVRTKRAHRRSYLPMIAEEKDRMCTTMPPLRDKHPTLPTRRSSTTPDLIGELIGELG